MDYKHIIRYLKNNKNTLSVQKAYHSCINNNDKLNLIQIVETILHSFGGIQYEYTSGKSYSINKHAFNHVFINSHDNPKIIKNAIVRILQAENISSLIFYGFYIGPQQFLEEGYHLIFFYKHETNHYKKNEWHIFSKKFLSNIYKNGLVASISYKSLFNNGFLFGGENVLIKLLPFFRNIWTIHNKWLEESKEVSNAKMIFFGTMVLHSFIVCCQTSHLNIRQILTHLCERHRCEISDMCGFSSIHSGRIIASTFTEIFKDDYNVFRKEYEIFISTTRHINNTKTLLKFEIESILHVIRLNHNNFDVPNFCDRLQNSVVINCNVISHIFSIMDLTPKDLFIASCFMQKYYKNDKI